MSIPVVQTQISLPKELYDAISRSEALRGQASPGAYAIAVVAQAHGRSISNEIVSLLTSSLIEVPTELDKEFKAWEAASDEDWLSLETTLASEVD